MPELQASSSDTVMTRAGNGDVQSGKTARQSHSPGTDEGGGGGGGGSVGLIELLIARALAVNNLSRSSALHANTLW